MSMRMIKNILVSTLALLGLMAGEAFAQASATVTVNANVPRVCRFISTTGSFDIQHSAAGIDQASASNAIGSTTLNYRCTNTVSPLFNIDTGSYAASIPAPGEAVTLISGANTMTAAITVTGAVAGTGLGGTENKPVTIGGFITPANFQNAFPGLYAVDVTIGIQAAP